MENFTKFAKLKQGKKFKGWELLIFMDKSQCFFTGYVSETSSFHILHDQILITSWMILFKFWWFYYTLSRSSIDLLYTQNPYRWKTRTNLSMKENIFSGNNWFFPLWLVREIILVWIICIKRHPIEIMVTNDFTPRNLHQCSVVLGADKQLHAYQ